jgi:Zn-dependent M16 (insulinase) family peptidase
MTTHHFPSRYKNFILKKRIDIQEIQSVLFELEHEKTKAKVFHIAHDDDENLFSLSFKTFPSSSNGVAHILEHTVLCGSKKFPVKDPFFAMTRRSLNTFMNAMTGMDFTCYPAASQNKKDFYNLLEVYLDAVFHPILDKRSFLQEGHRLEFQSKTNIKTPLTFQGIVYNEMKGTLNSPESRLYKKIYEALFPDLPYRFNSGGDPEEIIHLTYEELKDFHHTYYHPSRCYYFFYGNLPLEDHLDFLEEKILSQAERKEEIPPLPTQPRFSHPKVLDTSYPVAEKMKDQDFVAIAFLTTPIKNQVEFLALSLLEEILMESDASYLKKKLQESGLCVQADSFIDGEMSEIPFVFLMRGTTVENGEKIEKLLLDELKNFIQKPIPKEKIEAALHQMEIDRLEITDENGPYGLSLFLRSILIMQHGAKPEDGLFVHHLFDELKEKLKDENYLINLIKKNFLQNPHRVLVRLKADPELEKIEKQKEALLLKDIKEKLTEKELKEIVEKTKELESFQKKQESCELDVLPELELEDIEPSVKNFPLKHVSKDHLKVYFHEVWTNRFVYADLLYDLPNLEEKDWPMLKFLLSILTDLGAQNRSYEENLEFIQAKTGGIQAYFQLLTNVQEPGFIKPVIGIKGKSLFEHTESLFQLMKETLIKPKINDPKRIKELVFQTYTYLRDKFNRSSLGYCVKYALDGTNVYNSLNNSMSGIPYFKFIEGLSLKADNKVHEIIEELEGLVEKIFHFNKPELIISSDNETFQFLEKKEFFGIGKIPSKSYTPWIGPTKLQKHKNTAIEISSQVAFVCEAFSVFSIDDPLSPALTLATYIMENMSLHPLIREQGGAYGSSATYQPMVGNFYFHTYRDPNISKSYQAFQTAIEAMIKGTTTEQMLKDAKFEFIQEFDAPITPGMRAQTAYFYEKTHRSIEFRKEYKKRILQVSLNDVKEAVEKAFSKKNGTKVFACSKEMLEQEQNNLLEQAINCELLKILKNDPSE